MWRTITCQSWLGWRWLVERDCCRNAGKSVTQTKNLLEGAAKMHLEFRNNAETVANWVSAVKNEMKIRPLLKNGKIDKVYSMEQNVWVDSVKVSLYS